jgi:hypothetical protein
MDVEAIARGLSKPEEQRFFRDLVFDQRIAAFRASGLSECVLSEIRTHSDERKVLRWLGRDGNMTAVRAWLEGNG